MAAKQILRGSKAREKLLKGITELAETVTTTLGPKGRNIALDRRWSTPVILHDGVSVAREIELKDPFENMGVQLVREASEKTVDRAGDGTTTSTLLAYEIIKEGFKKIDEGKNPMAMKAGIGFAVSIVVDSVLKSAKTITTKEEIEQVGTISSADPEIGKLLADAIEKVTNNGVITVEDGKGFNTTIEYKEGVEFDHGYESAYLVTNKEKMIAEIENPYILFTDLKIDNPVELVEWLSKVLPKEEKEFVLIADSFDNQTLPTLVRNKEIGRLNIVAVQAPGFGIKRKWMLEDMAVLTGGTFISREAGRVLKSVTASELGRAEKVWCDVDHTRIIGGKGEKTQIQLRAEQVKAQIEQLTSDYEKKQMEERIAKLTGGVAIIKVGAYSETELKEKKERIIDAVEATKAAVAEGIVAGGGVSLFRERDKIFKENFTDQSDDFKAGVQLVYFALGMPIVKLLQNAGIVLKDLVLPVEDVNIGINVETGQQVDMFDAGIVDPAKVVRTALQNAASVASMVLTTEGLVTEYPEKEKIVHDKE